jgi:hypothetical protein
VNDEAIKLTPDLSYYEQPIQILKFGEKELRHKKIPLVKVLSNQRLVEDATQETESDMR